MLFDTLTVGAIGIDLVCKLVLSIADSENRQQIDTLKFLQNAEVENLDLV